MMQTQCHLVLTQVLLSVLLPLLSLPQAVPKPLVQAWAAQQLLLQLPGHPLFLAPSQQLPPQLPLQVSQTRLTPSLSALQLAPLASRLQTQQRTVANPSCLAPKHQQLLKQQRTEVSHHLEVLRQLLRNLLLSLLQST